MTAKSPNPRRATLIAGLTVSAALALGGCLERRDEPPPEAAQPCTECHGDPSREGDDLLRAAPPGNLDGDQAIAAPGVGSHQIHLQASDTHAAVACVECHVVPTETYSPGHVDTQLPAEVEFGALARLDQSAPSYDFAAHTCQNTYCHAAAQPDWLAPRDSDEACGSCHGEPPPAPHPQESDCSICHGEVIDGAGVFLAPERHVDGVVDVARDCNSCHGGPDSNAPPTDLSGIADVTSVGVGAHQAHLGGRASSRALNCAECHTVPDDFDAPGHLDDTPGAEVTLTGVALASGATATWSRASASCAGTWCHGPTDPAGSVSPDWTLTSGPLDCTSCHGAPPPAPHPQSTACSSCHPDVVDDSGAIVARDRHVDGTVDVVQQSCSSCHGSPASDAPPADLLGNTDVTSPGVGAHQAHLIGTGNSRPLQCSECHTVPTGVADPGHLDPTPGAEVQLLGVATIGGGAATWDAPTATCDGIWCHGPSNPSTSSSPEWTLASGPLSCTGCHGAPPPAPHPPRADCAACHPDIVDATQAILAPDRHVDGTVDAVVTCSSCHGTPGSFAPPPNLVGDVDITSDGVGAHQVHLTGGAISRPLQCNECHTVPAAYDDPGHLDATPGAEVMFTGAAVTGGAPATWADASATCTGTWCHGPADPTSSASPAWTDASGRLGCTDCHGLPPPAPHPALATCSMCHSNIDATFSFADRTLHVNGAVDF